MKCCFQFKNKMRRKYIYHTLKPRTPSSLTPAHTCTHTRTHILAHIICSQNGFKKQTKEMSCKHRPSVVNKGHHTGLIRAFPCPTLQYHDNSNSHKIKTIVVTMNPSDSTTPKSKANPYQLFFLFMKNIFLDCDRH